MIQADVIRNKFSETNYMVSYTVADMIARIIARRRFLAIVGVLEDVIDNNIAHAVKFPVCVPVCVSAYIITDYIPNDKNVFYYLADKYREAGWYVSVDEKDYCMNFGLEPIS